MIAPKRCRHGFSVARVVHLALFIFPAFTYGQQHYTGGDMQTSTSNSPGTGEHHTTATQADAWFENYRVRDGETLPRLRIHYATLGSPHRNAQGQIDNAVLVIHWTGADGNTLLSKNYMEALFAPGRPLDATRYFLIFPDNVGHGKSSKPSDGLRAAFPKYGYVDMVDLQHRLVDCRSEFVSAQAAAEVRVFPLDRASVGGVGIDVATEFARQVRNCAK